MRQVEKRKFHTMTRFWQEHITIDSISTHSFFEDPVT